MKKTICIILAAALLLALAACTDNAATETTEPETAAATALPAGLFLPVEGLPGIEECAADGYEAREDQFPAIASVNYLAAGTSTSISANDERVFRLLNFIGRSFDEGSFGMQFGYEEPDEIAQWYEDPEPMLEIAFVRADTPATEGLGLCSKLLIRGGTVLKLLDARLSEDQTERGVLLWPYNLLLKENALRYLGYPEKESWIDLLIYAGFSE